MDSVFYGSKRRANGHRFFFCVVMLLIFWTGNVFAMSEQTLLERAQTAEKAGQWRRAESSYRHLIKQNNAEPAYPYRLAVVLFRRGETAASQSALNQALVVDANYAPALMMQAAQKQQAGQVDDAISLYQLVLNENATHLSALDQLITLHEAKGDDDIAAVYQAQRAVLTGQ